MCLTFLNPAVFVYSLLSPTHSLGCISVYMCVSVCVLSGNGPFRAAGLSLLTEGSSLSLGDKANRKWEFTLAYFTTPTPPTPKKSCLLG